MVYRIKRPSAVERELKVFREKTKGKPTFKEVAREGTRIVAGVPQKTHKKGQLVEYKGKVSRVDKVTKKGVYIIPYKDKDKDGLIEPEKKKVFISDKEIQEGKIYPVYAFTLT